MYFANEFFNACGEFKSPPHITQSITWSQASQIEAAPDIEMEFKKIKKLVEEDKLTQHSKNRLIILRKRPGRTMLLKFFHLSIRSF